MLQCVYNNFQFVSNMFQTCSQHFPKTIQNKSNMFQTIPRFPNIFQHFQTCSKHFQNIFPTLSKPIQTISNIFQHCPKNIQKGDLCNYLFNMFPPKKTKQQCFNTGIGSFGPQIRIIREQLYILTYEKVNNR